MSRPTFIVVDECLRASDMTASIDAIIDHDGVLTIHDLKCRKPTHIIKMKPELSLLEVDSLVYGPARKVYPSKTYGASVSGSLRRKKERELNL